MATKRFVPYIEYVTKNDFYINLWDDDDTMYPEMWRQHFIWYTVTEARNIIRERLKEKYPNTKIILAHNIEQH